MCPSPSSYILKAKSSLPHDVFRDKIFKEVIKVRSIGWTLIRYDWGSYKRRRIGYTAREDHMKTQREVGPVSTPKEEGIRRKQPYLDLKHLMSGIVRKLISVVISL